RRVAPRHPGLPDDLAGPLLEGDQRGFLAAWRDDHLVAVDQRRFAVRPRRHAPAEVAGEALAPDYLAVRHLQADEVAAQAEHVGELAIDRRRAARPLLSLRLASLVGIAQPRAPQFLAVLLVQRPGDFVVAAVGH